MSRALAIVVAAGLLTTGAARADPAVHALFVGVNHYAYGDTHPGETDFKNLNGALNDVDLVKAALAQTYRLPLDKPSPKTCEAPGGVTVTLVDECATRVRIMASLQGAIAASHKDDIVLFYFAGHGSRLADPIGDKPSGRDSTILQSDARVNMNDPNSGDIMGVEIERVINAASLKGVNVVTIFDSCNSEGATRSLLGDVGERYAPKLTFPPGVTHRLVLAPGPQGAGYIVHLAAAEDDTASHEIPMPDGKVHGVFSYALAKALRDASATNGLNLSYQDMFEEAKRNVTSLGYAGQKPTSDGAVTATFLGHKAVSARVLAVKHGEGGGLVLAGGSLSGVEAGSVYGLFATNAQAASGAPPTSGRTATVASPVGAYAARLIRDAASSTAIDPKWARELQHKYSTQGLVVEIRVADPMLDKKIWDLLTDPDLSLVQAIDPTFHKQADASRPQYFVVADARGVQLRSADGAEVGGLLDPKDPLFADKLMRSIRLTAKYETILGLRKGAVDVQPTISLSSFGQDGREMPVTGSVMTIKRAQEGKIILTNNAPTARYLYLFILDPSTLGIKLVEARRDTPVRFEAGQFATYSGTINWKDDTAGRVELLTLSTAEPINAAEFNQEGVTRGAPANPLEDLVLSAKTGTRSHAEPPVTTWGAAIATIDVVE